MDNIEDRWQIKCDLCGITRTDKDCWVDEHVCIGICGYNFTFCKECEKNEPACDRIIWDFLKKISEERRKGLNQSIKVEIISEQ